MILALFPFCKISGFRVMHDTAAALLYPNKFNAAGVLAPPSQLPLSPCLSHPLSLKEILPWTNLLFQQHRKSADFAYLLNKVKSKKKAILKILNFDLHSLKTISPTRSYVTLLSPSALTDQYNLSLFIKANLLISIYIDCFLFATSAVKLNSPFLFFSCLRYDVVCEKVYISNTGFHYLNKFP